MRINRTVVTAAAAAVVATITCVLACTEGEIDLSKYNELKAKYEYLDTPTEMEMLVGDEMSLPVHVRNAGGARITAESADYDIVSVHEKDDTTILFRAVSEGETTVRLSCADNTHDIRVTVKEIYINSLSVSPASIEVFNGEDTYMDLTVDPDSYPVQHLKKEIADTSILEVIPYYDSTLMRNTIRLVPDGVGRTEFTLSGRRSDGTSASVTVPVTVKPVMIERIALYVLSDSTFVKMDTLYRVNGKKVEQYTAPHYSYSYTEVTGNNRAVGLKDPLVLVLSWVPEKATVVDASLKIAYVNEKTTLKMNKNDKNDTGVDADSLYAKIQGGEVESYEDFNKIFGSKGVSEDLQDQYCSADRAETSKYGFFTYNLIPKKKGVVVFRATAKYKSDIDGNVKKMSKKFMIHVQNKDHVDRWW